MKELLVKNLRKVKQNIVKKKVMILPVIGKI